MFNKYVVKCWWSLKDFLKSQTSLISYRIITLSSKEQTSQSSVIFQWNRLNYPAGREVIPFIKCEGFIPTRDEQGTTNFKLYGDVLEAPQKAGGFLHIIKKTTGINPTYYPYSNPYFYESFCLLFKEYYNTTIFQEVSNDYSIEYYKDILPLFKKYVDDVLKLVFSRFEKHYIFSTNSEETNSAEYLENVEEFKKKIVNVLVMTYERYSSILDAYAAQKENLLKGIKASSTGFVGFNDTPQDGGAYADDEHRTNITESKTENETDGATPVERLSEIERKYSNVLKDWSDEFEGLFIEEGNI